MAEGGGARRTLFLVLRSEHRPEELAFVLETLLETDLLGCSKEPRSMSAAAEGSKNLRV
jgi:hypothetical protein